MYISNEGILVVLFVGLVAGWLAGKIVHGTGFGIIGDILVGIAGAAGADRRKAMTNRRWRGGPGSGVPPRVGWVSMPVIRLPFPGNPKP